MVNTLGQPARKTGYTVRAASELMGSWGVVLAVYGPAGAGKTTLAGQAADSEYAGKLLVIDCEGGTRAIGDRTDIDVIRVSDSDAQHESGMGFGIVGNILDDLIEGHLKYGTVILDNMSELNAMCVTHVLRTVPRNVDKRDLPDQKSWNTTTAAMLMVTRRFRDFAQQTGTNIVFVAWDRAQEDRVTGVNKRDLALNPALANQFPGLIDIVAYLTVTAKNKRTLSFEASASTAAKFRRSPTEAAMSIPGELVYDFGSKNKPMAHLFDTLRGGKPFPAHLYTQGRQNPQTPANVRATITGTLS